MPKKKTKKKGYKFSQMAIMLVIGIALVSGVVIAQSLLSSQETDQVKADALAGAKQRLEDAYLEQLMVGGEELSLGSSGETATITPSSLTNYPNGINVDTLRFGNTNYTLDREGKTSYFRVEDFVDATTTAVAWQNNMGENIYLEDLFVQVLGKATTSVRWCITTSTDGFITSDDPAFLAEDAGTCTLLRGTGNSFGADGGTVATSTNIFAVQNAGTNTHIANAQLPVLIEPDTYILLHATSSGDRNLGITQTGNTFDGEMYLQFRTID